MIEFTPSMIGATLTERLKRWAAEMAAFSAGRSDALKHEIPPLNSSTN